MDPGQSDAARTTEDEDRKPIMWSDQENRNYHVTTFAFHLTNDFEVRSH